MNHPRGRPGLSLLEVLVALAIFLITMAVIGHMLNSASERALNVQLQGQAAQLCQAKLAEVNAGAIPLTPQSEVPLEEDPTWVWSMEAEQQQVANLWRVSVRVSREQPGGSRIENVLSQMVFDPSMRGSAQDQPAAITGSDSGTGGGSGGSPSSGQGGGSTQGGSPSSGGGGWPSGGSTQGPSGSTTRPPSGGSGRPTGGSTGPSGGGPTTPSKPAGTPGGSSGPATKGGRP